MEAITTVGKIWVMKKKVTVQGTITQALRKICKYAGCSASGASRTDAGVHAQGQVAKLSIPLEITAGKLLLGLNFTA
jgi:tRNA pseudouridine38-40 synthase